MHTDYSYRGESLFYKHEVSHNLHKDAYSMHSHNMYELLYFVSGDATHVIEDRKYKLTRGDLVLVRPGRYHFLRIDSDREYERYNLLFDADALGLLEAERVCERFEVVSLVSEPTTAALFPKLEYYRARLLADDFRKAAIHLLFELFYDLSLLRPAEDRP